MKLSRKRAFMACKYSSHFHKYFFKLFPDVKLSYGAWYSALAKYRIKYSELRNHDAHQLLKDSFYTTEREMAKNLAEKFFTKDFQKAFENAKLEKFQVDGTKKPLFDFTKDLIENIDDKEKKFEMEGFKDLLEMNKQHIRLKHIQDLENTIQNNDKPSFIMAKFPKLMDISKSDAYENVVFTNDLKCQKLENGKSFDYKPFYWRTKLNNLRDKLGYDRKDHHTKITNLYLMSVLPENFAWILRYFSALLDVLPTELYTELVKIETFVDYHQPSFFGNLIRKDGLHNGKQGAHLNELRYRLCL